MGRDRDRSTAWASFVRPWDRPHEKSGGFFSVAVDCYCLRVHTDECEIGCIRQVTVMQLIVMQRPVPQNLPRLFRRFAALDD